MAQISNINPQRIQWCCDQLHMTPRQLADQLKLDANRLADAKLTMPQLRKVADYFDHDIFFFAEQGNPCKTIYSDQFWALAKQTQLDSNQYKIIRQVERCRNFLISILESNKEEMQFKPPRLEGSISDKASVIRNWLGINYNQEKDYDFNIYRNLIGEKGIFVQMSTKDESEWKVNNPDKMSGFSMSHSKMPVIFITKTCHEQQAYTLFHELGHILLHHDSFFDDPSNFLSSVNSIKEIEANDFAQNCFLTDEDASLLDVPQNHEEYDEYFKSVAEKRGISVELVIDCLFKKQKIQKEVYDNYKNKYDIHSKSQQPSGVSDSINIPSMYSDQECLELLHSYGSRYVDTILDSMRKGDITLYRACKALGIKVSDMTKLLRRD